jgi:hypothetical protein
MKMGGFAILMIGIGIFGIVKIKNSKSGNEMIASIKIKFKKSEIK